MAEKPGDQNILTVVGANHRSSTMVFRDQVAIRNGQLNLFLERLSQSGIEEAIVLSDTDRTEIYLGPTEVPDAAQEVVQLLSAQSGVGRADVEAQTYSLAGDDAARHLLSVCSALDGLVIGDPRLPENLKSAFAFAQEKYMTGPALDAAMEIAFAAANRVRRETDIGRRPVSIPAAAVQVARDLHGDLDQCTGLLVGAGEMGELLANSLLSAGLKNLIVAHPTASKAEALAHQLNCHIGDVENLTDLMSNADIVLTSMNSRRFSLSAGSVQEALSTRRRKPIFLIDTGVPGDIDHTVENLEDAYLYSLDDLERVTREGWDSREKEAEKAWTIVEEETSRLVEALSDMVPAPALPSVADDDLEELRRSALEDADGDADEATKLLIERLRESGGATPANRDSTGSDEDGNR